MKVLVPTASKHGATTGLGEAVGAALGGAGLDVTTMAGDEVGSVGGYDAVVIGSGIYAGRWLEPAKRLLAREEATLRTKPVWLFSSGPVGDPPRPLENPAEVAGAAKRIDARSHRLFAGKIEGSDLGISEKALVALVRAEEGDFRPWSDIATWAESIAQQLREPPAAS